MESSSASGRICFRIKLSTLSSFVSCMEKLIVKLFNVVSIFKHIMLDLPHKKYPALKRDKNKNGFKPQKNHARKFL
jgi:hypothetical protein